MRQFDTASVVYSTYTHGMQVLQVDLGLACFDAAVLVEGGVPHLWQQHLNSHEAWSQSVITPLDCTVEQPDALH